MAEENQPDPEEMMSNAFLTAFKKYDQERAEWDAATAANKTEGDPPPKSEGFNFGDFLLGGKKKG